MWNDHGMGFWVRFLPSVALGAYPLAMGYVAFTRKILKLHIPECYYVDAGLLFLVLTLVAYMLSANAERRDRASQVALDEAEARWMQRFAVGDHDVDGSGRNTLRDLAAELVRRVEARS